MSGNKLIKMFSELIDSAKAKFDETCDVAINVRMSKSDKSIRGFVDLPHSHGRKVKVLIFSNNSDINGKDEDDVVISEGSLDQLKTIKLNFDVAVADLSIMSKLGPSAKIIGPKGLMPNAKDGCVAKDVQEVLGVVKNNRVRFASDKYSCINFGLGKLSIGAEKLLENLKVSVDAIVKASSSTDKGFIKSCYIASTMGKSYNIDVSELYGA